MSYPLLNFGLLVSPLPVLLTCQKSSLNFSALACRSTKSPWICLRCGSINCGRYNAKWVPYFLNCCSRGCRDVGMPRCLSPSVNRAFNYSLLECRLINPAIVSYQVCEWACQSSPRRQWTTLYLSGCKFDGLLVSTYCEWSSWCH